MVEADVREVGCVHIFFVGWCCVLAAAKWQCQKIHSGSRGEKQLQKSNEKQFATKVMRSEKNKSHQRNVHKCSKVQIDIKVGHEI